MDEQYEVRLLVALERIAGILRKALRQKVFIRCHVDEDREFGQKIFQRISMFGDIELCDMLVYESDISELYGKAALVLSNRMHVLLFVMCCLAIPVVVTDKSGYSKIRDEWILKNAQTQATSKEVFK